MLNVIVVLTMFMAALLDVRRGAASAVAGAFGWLLSYAFVRLWVRDVGGLASDWLANPAVSRLVGSAALCALTVIAVYLTLRRVAAMFAPELEDSADRAIALGVGFFRGALMVSVVYAMAAWSSPALMSSELMREIGAQPVIRVVTYLLEAAAPGNMLLPNQLS